MNPHKVDTPGLKLAAISINPQWEITYHRLFHVSPDNADQVTIVGADVTIWDLCFTEDLLQMFNAGERLLLDVGWSPHADPAGTFRLRVVRLQETAIASQSFYDWQHPIMDLRMRSLDDLLHEIHKITNC